MWSLTLSVRGNARKLIVLQRTSPALTTVTGLWSQGSSTTSGKQHPILASCSGINTTVRWKSSSSSKRGGSRFHLDALPFSISPEEALLKFRGWAEDDQGLRYLMNYSSVRIGAAYVPVWSFDINVRFGGNWKPPSFSVYQGDTVHLPGLSAYAGYSYRRSLMNPVHSTSLVFLGDQTQRFGGWMLKDMVLQETGTNIPVIPDAWNATRGQALQIVLDELQGIASASWPLEDSNAPKIQTEVVKSRRVFMPTFVVEYSVLGLQHQAFVSGCDKGAGVAGVSHQLFGEYNLFQNPEFHQQSRNFLTWSSSVIQLQNLPFLLRLFRPVLTLGWFALARIWSSIPVLGVAGGVLTGYRKVLQPWMDAQTATADWERQREHEAKMGEDDIGHKDDFVDSGSARGYFIRNRDHILRHLGGVYEHEEGQYDWYKEWQSWAQQQWGQQTQQQQHYYQQQQNYQRQHQQQSQSQQQQKTEFHWEFDADDPYSILGIKRGATKDEVSRAFRTQMLRHHPDTQPNASNAQKRRLVERSKLITDAYRKIKVQMK